MGLNGLDRVTGRLDRQGGSQVARQRQDHTGLDRQGHRALKGLDRQGVRQTRSQGVRQRKATGPTISWSVKGHRANEATGLARGWAHERK